MTNRLFEGKDLAEALAAASTRLGIAEPDLDYEIVEQGRRGLFGIGAKNVSIRVMPPLAGEQRQAPARKPKVAAAAPSAAAPAPAEAGEEGRKRRRRRGGRRGGRGRDRAAAANSEGGNEVSGATPRAARPQRAEAPPAPQEAVDQVQATVARMMELLGLEMEVAAKPAAGGTELELGGADQDLLTHDDAETIDAWQFLLNRMSRRSWPDAGRIQVYCNGQHQTRDEDLLSLSRETAEKVLRDGRPCRLRPMNSYERRLVHLTVRKMNGVDSRSEGEGPMKSVRVFKRRRRGRPPRKQAAE